MTSVATRLARTVKDWYRDDKWSPVFPTQRVHTPVVYKQRGDGKWVTIEVMTPIEAWRGEIRKFGNKKLFLESLCPSWVTVHTPRNPYAGNGMSEAVANNFHLIDRVYDELC